MGCKGDGRGETGSRCLMRRLLRTGILGVEAWVLRLWCWCEKGRCGNLSGLLPRLV